ncbi:MAG: DUF378 domain-containing protein [Planctomycetota bacterium]|jgi:uncharacterized membrane protein YuzA (DUF378 family)
MKVAGLKMFDCVVGALVLIGALNWGLVGVFGFDLVARIFGEMTVVTRLVYTVVGLAALYGRGGTFISEGRPMPEMGVSFAEDK